MIRVIALYVRVVLGSDTVQELGLNYRKRNESASRASLCIPPLPASVSLVTMHADSLLLYQRRAGTRLSASVKNERF